MNGYFRGTPIFETFIKVAPAKSDSWKWLMANLSEFSVFFLVFPSPILGNNPESTSTLQGLLEVDHKHHKQNCCEIASKNGKPHSCLVNVQCGPP